MKKTLMLSLVTVLALGVAGIGWAAYPAADEATAPATLEALEAEANSSALEAFEAENDALAAEFEALLGEPVQVADCCMMGCRNELAICKGGCFGQPDAEACKAQCQAQYDACRSFC